MMTAYDFTVYGRFCNGKIVVVAETREEAVSRAQEEIDEHNRRWFRGCYKLDTTDINEIQIDGATLVHFDDGET